MPRFLVLLHARTPLMLPENGIEVGFPDEQATARVLNIGQRFGSEWIHTGIEFRLWVSSIAHGTATARALALAENTANLLAFTHSAGIALEESTWTIDLDESVRDRSLVQHFVNVPTFVPPPRTVDEDLLARVAGRVTAAMGPTETATQLRRAMWHLRNAAAVDDLVEQFSELWLGLESINHLLVTKNQLQTKFVARMCNSCGAPMEVSGSSAGITHAIVTLAGGSRDDAKMARRLRQSLHHGLGRIYEDRSLLPRTVPLLQDALTLSIADVMEIESSLVPRLKRKTYSLSRSRGEVTARVTLYDLPVDVLVALPRVPQIDLVILPRDGAEATQGTGRPHHGTYRLSVLNHDGRWGDGEITWRGRGDPEAGRDGT